jgi:hypothetical protein
MPGFTPNKGIRYPLMSEAGDPNVIAAETFDLDAMATADDALRTTALTQRGALVTNSVAPSVAKGVAVKFTFDTVTIDPQGLFVANDRFTITKPGLYLFGAAWQLFNSTGLGVSFAEVTIAKNTTAAPAVPNIRRRKMPGAGLSGFTIAMTVSAPYVMAASDFVTMQTFWSGSAAGPASGSKPFFWCLPLALT